MDRILAVTPIDNGLGGMIFRETPVDPPYVKDYDAIEGNTPQDLGSTMGPLQLGDDLGVS